MEEPDRDSTSLQPEGPSLTGRQDDSSQRGRKRRRTSDSVTAAPAAHNPSGGSTTLRGRARRRPTSGASSQTGSTRSASILGRKYQKTPQALDIEPKKRSQSPSRSRSGEGDRTPRRRRQRTASRSRPHRTEKGKENGSRESERDDRKIAGGMDRIKGEAGRNAEKETIVGRRG